MEKKGRDGAARSIGRFTEIEKREARVQDNSLYHGGQYVIGAPAITAVKGNLYSDRAEKSRELIIQNAAPSKFLVNRRTTDNQVITTVRLMIMDQIIISVPVSRENR